MAINIKNDETQQLTRELAALAGESVTTAVTIAVRERLERLRKAELTTDQRAAKILALGSQIAASAGPTPMQVTDLYDDAGLPA
jgi:antitoxin VapB